MFALDFIFAFKSIFSTFCGKCTLKYIKFLVILVLDQHSETSQKIRADGSTSSVNTLRDVKVSLSSPTLKNEHLKEFRKNQCPTLKIISAFSFKL